jgi:peptide/nickel transport system substrate-binding protein
MLSRRDFIAGAAGAAASGALPAASLRATPAQVLRIAMTAADVPTPTGIPNNGFEGYRFMGYTAYDALVNWDLLHHHDKPAEITPGLFTSWHTDPNDIKRWIFSVRRNVRFHDGSPFDADAVIWNLRRIYDDKSPQYDAASAPIVRAAVYMIDGFEKADDGTIIITTTYPFTFLPYLLTRILIASPTQWAKVGKNWAAFAKAPSGTGPFRITNVVLGQYAELSRNENYWDKARIPKLDKMVLYPMPEATTRVAALRSGQVDWIEVPAPDAIPSLKAAGFKISLWPYPHTYPYVFDVMDGSPFRDVRVRRAMNYAIDRENLCKLINNTGIPAVGLYTAGTPYFGKPREQYRYDPVKAKALLKEAGYGPDKPLKARIMISNAGSGQMVPIPINEYLQTNFKAVGIDVSFDVVEWDTMLLAVRSTPQAPQSHGDQAINISLSWVDPAAMFRYYDSKSFSPHGFNWGHWSDPRVDRLLEGAQSTTDRVEQTRMLAEAHGIVVDEAPWLFIVHDLDPRALSPKVHGFRPAQSWFQDFTQITLSTT